LLLTKAALVRVLAQVIGLEELAGLLRNTSKKDVALRKRNDMRICNKTKYDRDKTKRRLLNKINIAKF